MIRFTEGRVDVVVVGSGIAGLTFALRAAEHASVLVVTKKNRAASNTNYARGGIAAVIGDDDGVAFHVRDTLRAGAGLCHRDVVEMVVREGRAAVEALAAWGTEFARADGDFSLGREGGHSRRRIVHAGDRTGRAIESALLTALERSENVTLVEDLLVVDLWTEHEGGTRVCRGIEGVRRHSGTPVRVEAHAVFLASGGAGQVWAHTTNPGIATGDGVAMAHRAGARIANMEFIQFHPTALFPTEDPAFLISEALRGEGAVLRRLDGGEVVTDHRLGSLAPRDVVARSIDRTLRETGDPHVLLDVTAIPDAVLESRFPAAVAGCRERGVDPRADGIPVVPAAHYVCGGVWTDDVGRTSLRGLYAAGEVACTGIHGGNRLASNSLLEAVVFSGRAARAITAEVRARGSGGSDVDALVRPVVDDGWDDEPRIDPVRRDIRRLMWEKAGIVRSLADLQEADDELEARVRAEEGRFAELPRWSTADVERRNLAQTAHLVVRSALRRRESRGLHWLVDHPWRDNERFLRDTVLDGGDGVGTKGNGGRR